MRDKIPLNKLWTDRLSPLDLQDSPTLISCGEGSPQ